MNEINRNTSSVTVKHISSKTIADIPLPLPPSNEQKRIVTKVKTLFAERTTALDALVKANFLLQKFRQSVLIRAFNGDLTKKAINHNDSGKILLERIKKAKKQRITGKMQESLYHVEALYKIPDDWVWASVDEICWKVTDGEHNKPQTVAKGVPLLSAKNIRDGYLDFRDVDFVTENIAEKCLKRCNPELGDILIVCVGATIGRTSIVIAPRRFCLQRTVGLLKPVKEEILTEYLYYFLKSGACQNQINSFIRATAIPHFNIDKMKKISVPIPSVTEQKIIVEKISKLFNLANKIQKDTKIAFEKVNAFDQALLAKAFRGELVPQDPDDEPSSVLLERIKAQS